LQLEDVRLELLKAATAKSMLEHLLSLPLNRSMLAALLLWDWWTTRNKCNAGELERSTEQVCHVIQRHYIEFLPESKCEKSETPQEENVVRQAQRWSKPERNFTKVNFDAAFHQSNGFGAWGLVARTDEGEFIAAAAGKLRHLHDALQAEAEACVAATEGAVALGLHRVVFESDSKNLVQALNSESHDLSKIGVLIREARSICISYFESFEFTFVSRHCNKVAHTLAQYGYTADDECRGWAEDAPDFVSALVASDVAEPSV
jgi:ribonuclease HI